MKHAKQIETFSACKDGFGITNLNIASINLTCLVTSLSESLVTKKIFDVEFDIPDGFNVNVELVKTLRKQQKAIQADAQMKFTQLEERIQSLLCIEHKEVACKRTL